MQDFTVKKITLYQLYEKLKEDGVDIDYKDVGLLYKYICRHEKPKDPRLPRVTYEDYIKMRDLLR